MKKIMACLLILCLLPAVSLAAEKLPAFKFSCANMVGFLDDACFVQADVNRRGSLNEKKEFTLKDDQGRVWATKNYAQGDKISFKVTPDETMLGGYDLSIWQGETLVSVDTMYIAVTNKHQKAVVKVETDQPYMAISFDCAYMDDQTDEILDILNEYGVKATFFMTGDFLKGFADSARKIRDAGMEVACHSLSHPHLLEYGLNMRFKQVRKNVQMIRETLGVTPRLFRPPFGEFDSSISAPARAEGMEMCLWTIDSNDWNWNFTQEDVIKRVEKDVTPGTIILFHLDGFFTPEVIREVIPYYQNELGLTLVPITELMDKGGLTLPPSPYLEDTEPDAA